MSISSATDRLPSTRRVQPRHMVGALLLAVGLLAVLLTITISSTTTTASRPTAHPAAINATPSHPVTQPTDTLDSNVPSGTFRDPVTHALFPVNTPPAPQRETGHGPQ
ncbi:MAG: hypothetical protein JO304_02050 [Solirubrobacterales bacterium]|nr:hypothetical protein [Solirubrobacterales bacterium]